MSQQTKWFKPKDLNHNKVIFRFILTLNSWGKKNLANPKDQLKFLISR